jgi:hypothetical protein
MVPSQREPTCRTSNSLNLSERRSPTWSNGRYRPRSPSPASACGTQWVCHREAYRASDTIASRLRLFLDCRPVTLHYCFSLFRRISAIHFSFAPLKPRKTHTSTPVLLPWAISISFVVSPHPSPLHVHVAVAYLLFVLSAMEQQHRV